jgi:hypothetical protein
MVDVPIKMKLTLVMAYFHIKMHLAPTMVYTFFKSSIWHGIWLTKKKLNLAWDIVNTIVGTPMAFYVALKFAWLLNTHRNLGYDLYLIKMQLISTMAYVSIETQLALYVPIETLVMVNIPNKNHMALTMAYVFIGTCFPFVKP